MVIISLSLFTSPSLLLWTPLDFHLEIMRNNAFAISAAQPNLLLTFLLFFGWACTQDRTAPPPPHSICWQCRQHWPTIKSGQNMAKWNDNEQSVFGFQFSVCSLVTGNVVPCLSQDSPRPDNTLNWYANCLPSLRVTDTGREQQQQRVCEREREKGSEAAFQQRQTRHCR